MKLDDGISCFELAFVGIDFDRTTYFL